MNNRIPATVLRDDAGTFFEIENFADRVLLTATAGDRLRAVFSVPLALAGEVASALVHHARGAGSAA